MADTKITALAAKTTLTGNDEFPITDSAGGNETKRIIWTNVLAALNALTITDTFSSLIASVTNQDYKLVTKAPFAGTITEVITICVSGTATFTVQVNTTALGGTANSVSSVEQAQAHSTTNTFVAGDDIVITASSNASCLRATCTIKFTRGLGLA